MRSLSLGKIFGIKVELHWSFLLIIFFIVISTAAIEPQSLLPTTMLFFFLFLSVFLHELTHSVVSIARGIKVHKIVLLPIGGVALTDELPDNAMDEFLIAISGPLFNFLVVFFVFLSVSMLPLPFPWHIFSSANVGEFEKAVFSYPLFAILYVNFILGAFNLLLPALPLDGGRVLRSLLSMRIGYLKATRIVTMLSAFVSVLLFLVGFFIGSLLMVVISAFIFFGAKEEERVVEAKHVIKHIKINQLIDPRPLLFEASAPLVFVVEELFTRNRSACLVDLGNNRFAVFDLNELPQNANLQAPIARYARYIEPVDISMGADKVLERFLTRGYSLLPVFASGQLIGVISLGAVENAYRLAKAKQLLYNASKRK